MDLTIRAKHLPTIAANPDKFFESEIFARVRVSAAPKSDVLIMPLAVMQSEPAGKMAFVQRGEESSKPAR